MVIEPSTQKMGIVIEIDGRHAIIQMFDDISHPYRYLGNSNWKYWKVIN